MNERIREFIHDNNFSLYLIASWIGSMLIVMAMFWPEQDDKLIMVVVSILFFLLAAIICFRDWSGILVEFNIGNQFELRMKSLNFIQCELSDMDSVTITEQEFNGRPLDAVMIETKKGTFVHQYSMSHTFLEKTDEVILLTICDYIRSKFENKEINSILEEAASNLFR